MSTLTKIRDRQSYIERISALSPRSIDGINTTLNAYEEFSNTKYNESTSDRVFEELQVLNGNTQLEAIYDVFQNFVNYLSSVRKINSHTIRQYAKLLRPYFNYRLSLRIHNEDLNENVKFPKPLKEEKYPLRMPEIRKILDAASLRRKAFYLFLASTGLRCGEAVQLRKRDFEAGQRYRIHVRASYTKTRQARTTFMSKEAEQFIVPILDSIKDDNRVFGKHPKPLYCVLLEDGIFNNVRKKAGLTQKYESGRYKISIHSFRSFFISQCGRVEEFLGHALAGHDHYMSEYDRYTPEEKLDFYLKAESYLAINDTTDIVAGQKELQKQLTEANKEIEKIKTEGGMKIKQIELDKDKKIDYLEKQVEEIRKGLQECVKVTMGDELKICNRDDSRIYFDVKLVTPKNSL